mmetsp:Transcript_28063/g.68020  ORF Transcript_28063/g.68020 Transcript_28063/m.68020 type:complete len:291 (+) Transcript_28063:211-1083(+)
MKKSSCYCRSGPGRLLDALSCFFRGVVMSEKWVEKLVSHAVAADPGPEYEVMPRISCTIFDNLTIRIAYKAYTTQNSTGFRMDMTNWVKIPLPQHIAPTFSAERICAAAPLKHLHICAISAHRSDLRRAGKEGLFKRSLSKREFLHKFSPHNLEVQRNKNERFVKFLNQVQQGKLFDRPAYTSPWTAYIQTMPTMPERLQGSYEDVEYELNHMRQNCKDHGSPCNHSCARSLPSRRISRVPCGVPSLFADYSSIRATPALSTSSSSHKPLELNHSTMHQLSFEPGLCSPS